MNPSRLSPTVLLAATLLVTGCASLSIDNMVAGPLDTNVRHPATVALIVEGGSPGVGWYSGTIKPAEFEEAVRRSLESSSLFSGLTALDVADYVLRVNLTFAGSHPGFNMSAWVNATWNLQAREARKEEWSTEIKGEGLATVGEAFVGAKRQFMALERAAKQNIDQALASLAALELSSAPMPAGATRDGQ